MKKVHLSKILSLTSALALTAGLLASCGNTASSAPAGGASAASTAPVTSEQRDVGNGLMLPIANGDVTLKFMVSDAPINFGMSLNNDTFPVIEAIEKNTGINMEYEAFHSNEFQSILDNRLATGGSDMPDMFMMGVGPERDLMSYGRQNIIVNVAPYLTEENTPNLLKFLEANPDIRGVLTSPDGAIYGLPSRVAQQLDEYSVLAVGYRKDWADKLDIAEPQTMEDWYKMLTVFKTGDPNGNGQPDETPLGAPYLNTLNNFSLAYGLSPWSGWFSVIDGKIHYDFTSDVNGPKAKEYIEEMRKWFAEGLIDQEYSIEHDDRATAALMADQVGARQNWSGYFPFWNKAMAEEGIENVNWVIAQPPAGPHGDRAYENYPAMNNERWVITSNCKNIEAALKWYDYLFATEEGSMLSNCGIEGEDWEMVDGKPQYTEAILKHEGFENVEQALVARNGGRLPIITNDTYAEVMMRGDMTDADIAVLAEARKYYRTMLPSMTTTKEESEILGSKLTDINTYRDEMFVKFVLGKESMDKYDDFIATLKSMGIDDIVAVRQAQYDRYVEAQKAE